LLKEVQEQGKLGLIVKLLKVCNDLAAELEFPFISIPYIRSQVLEERDHDRLLKRQRFLALLCFDLFK